MQWYSTYQSPNTLFGYECDQRDSAQAPKEHRFGKDQLFCKKACVECTLVRNFVFHWKTAKDWLVIIIFMIMHGLIFYYNQNVAIKVVSFYYW